MGKVFKMAIVGRKNVGKTTIVEQAIYGNIDKDSAIMPTIEDIYTALIETDRGTKEQVRIFDTRGIPNVSIGGPSPNKDMATYCAELAKKYHNVADCFILTYDTSCFASLDCLVTLKREIDKARDKKEATYLILGNRSQETKSDNMFDSPLSRASHWAVREKIKHFEVSAFDRNSLREPFVYITSKLSASSNKSSFAPLGIIRKSVRNEGGS